MSRIKIDPPNALPSTGLTPIQYKQWKIALKIFLQQTAEFREFYPGENTQHGRPLKTTLQESQSFQVMIKRQKMMKTQNT